MIFTTTNTVDGYEISKYLRIIAGETVTGINMLKDFGASIRNITGGRASGYESEAIKAREAALDELWRRGQELGADGVVGSETLWLLASRDPNGPRLRKPPFPP